MYGGFSSSISPIQTRRIPHPPIHTHEKIRETYCKQKWSSPSYQNWYKVYYIHMYISTSLCSFWKWPFDLMGGIWFIFFWRLCLLCSVRTQFVVIPEWYWVCMLRAQTIKFVERGLERLGLDHRTTIGCGLYGNLHGDELGMSSKAFFRCNLSGSSL